MKNAHTFIIFGYLLSVINTQDNLKCRLFDFNKAETILELEPCSVDEFVLTMKSYEEYPLDLGPYRAESENYLSSDQLGWSCLSTIQSFDVDENTEFYAAIHLTSTAETDSSRMFVQAFDGVPVNMINVAVVDIWDEYYRKYESPLENVKIHIRANIATADTRLAIEYLHITNTGIDDPECERLIQTTTEDTTTEDTTTEDTTTEDTTTEDTTTEDTTTEDTTTEDTTTEDTTTEDTTTEDTTTEDTTTEDTTTEDTTTEDTTTTSTTTLNPTISPSPVDSNDTKVWIIISFTFLLTTVIVIVGCAYLIYMYKTALAMKNILLSAPANQSTLPRLTVATNSNGNPIIVGIDKVKHI